MRQIQIKFLYPQIMSTGADEGNRTSDLRITNALLYQLSYIGDLIDGVHYKVLQPLQQTNLLVKAESGVRAKEALNNAYLNIRRHPSSSARGREEVAPQTLFR